MGAIFIESPDGIKQKFENLISANLELDMNNLPDYIPKFDIPMSASAEFEATCDLNVPLFEKLCGVDLSMDKDMVAKCNLLLRAPYKEQIRKHKKKRINKKWAKRYGYRTKYQTVIIEDVECIVPDCGEVFEFTGRYGGRRL